MFADAMNARRIIRFQASDPEHAASLEVLLRLTDRDVAERYCVGVRQHRGAVFEFVDGSAARCESSGRWVTGRVQGQVQA
jgi:hypothetical protein